MTQYNATIAALKENFTELLEEMIFLQQTQTAILRNDFYLIKDRDTQALFEAILRKNQPKAPSNNHQKAYDFKHAGQQISVKSGQYKNGFIKFSYSRTTEYPTLEEKINYLSSFENLILGLASEQIKPADESIMSSVQYYLYYFPANQINLRSMDWEEKDNQFIGIDKKNNIKVEIKRKMSDQPWITIPSHLVNCTPLISSHVANRQNRKYLAIEMPDNQERIFFDLYDQRKKMKSLKGISKCKESIQKSVMV